MERTGWWLKIKKNVLNLTTTLMLRPIGLALRARLRR
jgi:hypothetical protein